MDRGVDPDAVRRRARDELVVVEVEAVHRLGSAPVVANATPSPFFICGTTAHNYLAFTHFTSEVVTQHSSSTMDTHRNQSCTTHH